MSRLLVVLLIHARAYPKAFLTKTLNQYAFLTPLGQASYVCLDCVLPYLPVDITTGKMRLPSTVKRIKLDIGLSHNTTNSEMWLNRWVMCFCFPLFAVIAGLQCTNFFCRRFPDDAVVFVFELNPVGPLHFPQSGFGCKFHDCCSSHCHRSCRTVFVDFNNDH